MFDNEVEMKYENHYKCPYCNVEWDDTWDCMCNDKCPECNKEIEPYESIELETGETIDHRG